MLTSEPTSRTHVPAYRERVFRERDLLIDSLGAAGHWQRRVLADLLDANAGTEFGRAHGFDRIRTLDEFRAAVPIRDYAGLAPWIERMAAGERGLLTAEDPVVYFTSSGSTGAHKKIPITRRFMATSFFPFFYAAWAPMVEHHPAVLAGPDAMLNLKHDPLPVPATTADGHPHLGASQVDFGTVFGEPLSAEPGSAARWARLPVPVAPDDHLAKAYVRLRLAVEADLAGVIGINPAAVAALPYQLSSWWPRLVREVRDGTVAGVRVRDPNPARAGELEALARRFDPIRPAHVWPNVRVVFCWTGGVAGLYLPRLREEYGIGVEILPAPVAASEGPTAVTLDRHPRAAGLVVTAAVYEFVPADEPIRPDMPTLAPHEVEPGRDYQVIFSHVGGLYRYAGGDVVRVIDALGGTARVEYVGRAAVSDVAGERLREAHVVRALSVALGEVGVELRNVSCRVGGDPPGYEFAIAPCTPWSGTETTRLTERLDVALGTQSPGYRRARTQGRLTRPRLRLVDGTAFARDWQARVAAGVRPAQVKDRLFRPDPADWDRLFDPTAQEGSPA